MTISSKGIEPKADVRAACHIHSEWSYDANWKLPDLAQAFKKRGYGLMLMSEHDRGFTQDRWEAYQDACLAASSESIRIVPGIEYSDAENRIHVLVWGCSTFLGENLPTSELLKRVAEQGGVAVLAHPSRRSAFAAWRPEWEENLLGVELWNRKTDGWAPSSDAQALLKRTSLQSFVGLDFHDRKQWFPLSLRFPSSASESTSSAISALKCLPVASLAFGHPVERSLFGIVACSLSLAERARQALRPLVRYLRRSSGKSQRKTNEHAMESKLK